MKNINNDNCIKINNNFSKRTKTNGESKEAVKESVHADNPAKLNQDYSAIIGRSQIRFGSKRDSFASDLRKFVNNPRKIKNTNNFFDIAYNQYKNRIDAPYEYAALLAKEYYNMKK